MTDSESRHDIFQAIADPTRRSILRMLAEREMSIAAIKKCFTLSRTAVNKHLHLLEDAMAIVKRKQGRETRYAINPKPFRDAREWIAYFDEHWEESLGRLRKMVEEK